jgi:hypothetical protein
MSPTPPSIPTITPIDFATTPLSHYAGFYATVIDDVLSPSECAALRALAEETGEWTPAGLSAHGDTQTVHTNFRNSDRVICIDAPAADALYARLRPLVPELHVLTSEGPWGGITGKPGKSRRPSWRLAG